LQVKSVLPFAHWYPARPYEFEKPLCEKYKSPRPAKFSVILDQLFSCDVVLVTRLDHVVEAPDDLANILAAIAEKGARFHSLRWTERHRGGLLRGSIDRKLSRTKRAS